MVKRFVVLLTVLLFAVGAAGGCLNQTPPVLTGTWSGNLSRASNPTIQNFAEVTIDLIQSPNNQFSGTVTVTYNPNTSNPVTLNATIVSGESSTNEWNATIKANGTAGSNITIPAGNSLLITIQAGSTYTFTFILPHAYACRGGELNELVGTYALNIGSDVKPIDSGAVNLVKQ
jgi:hypothetical protein